jgi:hypothetical protein
MGGAAKLIATMICGLLACSTPASASLQISSFKDRMTDKTYLVASVVANQPDQGILATLQLACMNGSVMPSLLLSAPMTRGQIGVNWRLDEGRQRPGFLHVFSDPNTIPFVGVSPKIFYGKNRFRITIFPTGSKTLFWEFNVADAQKAINPIKCGSNSPK